MKKKDEEERFLYHSLCDLTIINRIYATAEQKRHRRHTANDQGKQVNRTVVEIERIKTYSSSAEGERERNPSAASALNE